MNRQSPYGTPMGSAEKGRSRSFQGFVRPSGQFSLYQSNSFGGSPKGGFSSNDFSEFIPLENSSPVKNRGRGSSGHWRGSNRSSYNNSPANSCYSSSSPYSPYSSNKSYNFSSRKSRGSYGNANRSLSRDISLYYHHSMVEDPWAELEKELQKSGLEQSKNLTNKSAEVVDAPLSDSDEGVDSQENESFVSSSEGSS